MKESSKIAKYFNWIEKVLIVIFSLSIIFKYFGVGTPDDFLLISSVGLAITFFFNAFIPHEIYESEEEAKEQEPFGMLDLLSLTIVPKVLWISTGVSFFALFLYFLNLDNGGHLRMASIGMLTIIISLIILSIALVSGIKQLKSLKTVLLRAIPALILDYYLLFGI